MAGVLSNAGKINRLREKTQLYRKKYFATGRKYIQPPINLKVIRAHHRQLDISSLNNYLNN